MKFVLGATIFFSMTVGSITNSALADSSFDEVRNVLLDREVHPNNQTEQEEFDVYRAGRLPQYEVKASNFVENGVNRLLERAKKTVTDKDDYYPRLTKLLHPNGICFTGEWTITEASNYTGYFARGARGLFVGRASVAMSETRVGEKRGFGFAGKIFPTEDPSQSVETANFFTVDVLMGTREKNFVATQMTNEPELGFDFGLIWLGMKVAKTLTKADENPGMRPVYPIAMAGLESSAPFKAPKWMKIAAEPLTSKIQAEDFREELNFERHHPTGIRMDISVSDVTKDRSTSEGWTRIGYIQLRESMVSYGCDRQLHFAHPKLQN